MTNKEYGRYDTLRFHAGLPPTNPRLWICSPHSTGVESYFLSGEKNVCYYREYDEDQKQFVWQVSDQLNPHLFKENRTQPVLKDKDGFYKRYSFIPGGGSEYLAAVFKYRISFYRYPTIHDAQLRDKIIAPSELNFSRPQGAVTAFIYDFKYIAVVSQEQIDFYGFDRAQKKRSKAKGIPPLRFTSLNQEKQ